MSRDFLSGNLYASVDDKTISMGNGLLCTKELDVWSTDEYVQETYSLKPMQQASMSFDISASDLSMLNELCRPICKPATFTYEYDVSIMIQARWHKKKRINKKWLNRFGMKSDTVKKRVVADVISCDTCTNSGEIEFKNTYNAEYIFRQDQMRKHLKMEYL